MAKDEQGARPHVNPDGDKSPLNEDEAREKAMLEKLALDEAKGGAITEGDLAAADLGALASQEQDPFSGYELKPEVNFGGFKASKTYLVFYAGRLVKDGFMQGQAAEHHVSVRLNGRREAVTFNRTVKGVKYPAAVVKDAVARAQLLFYRDQGQLKENDNYKVADRDQIPLLYKLFLKISPGESQLVKQIMGDE